MFSLLARFRVVGHSMEPFLKNGQTVLASPIPYIFLKPKVGDVAVFKYKGKTYIKRISKIKSDSCFLEGDNIKDSFDSKKIGWISRQQIIGKVVYKF